MKRRDFLRSSAAFFPVALLAPSLLSGCRRDDLSKSNKSVVIIGAGAAGLAAAYTLRQAGLKNIVVLEARDRSGGRLWSDRSLGFPVDLGASWIHGPSSRNPLVDLAASSGMTTFVTDDDSVVVYDAAGTAQADTTYDTKEAEYYDLIRSVLNSGSASQSVRDRIAALQPSALSDPWMLFFLSSYEEFDFALDIRDLNSASYQDDSAFTGTDVIITNGYDKLSTYLANGIDIRLGEAATAIDYSRRNVTVTTTAGSHEADFVVVTAPLGVLKAGQIAFSPALPDAHTAAIGRMKMGTVNKIVLKFPSAFWDTNLQFIGYLSPTKGKYNHFLNFRKFSNENVLMTFAFGEFAEQMEAQTDAQIQSDIMAHLQAIYGAGIPQPEAILVSRWHSDPYTQGSYTASAVGMDGEEFSVVAGSVEDRLFFAGEHTSQDYRGTVHGAYLSGVRAAEEIMDLI